jgi:predicted TPR repeat methyltransferase
LKARLDDSNNLRRILTCGLKPGSRQKSFAANLNRKLALASNIQEEARGLFHRALESQAQGRLIEAETLYLRILSLIPDRVSVLSNLSSVLLQQKKYSEAAQYIDKVLELSPDDEVAWLNKSIYQFHSQQPEDSLTSCDRALTIKADWADALSNRGLVLKALRRYEEALNSCARALAIEENHVEALSNRGLLLFELGRHTEALASFDRTLSIRPDIPEALHNRGDVLHALGREPEALLSYKAALNSGGNPEELHYYLAALGDGAPPPASPAHYVRALFDRYAARFDEDLAALQYHAPQLLFSAVSEGVPTRSLDIADLGCGTGLCGVVFRPLARTLTGVDISEGMLERARKREVYDLLIQEEVTEFLQARRASFDLLISADVFIYVGDLEPIFEDARTALRQGGQFIFSVETHDGAGFVLRPSRRYAHALSYLRECAAKHQFVENKVQPIALRQEFGQVIAGMIVVLSLTGD